MVSMQFRSTDPRVKKDGRRDELSSELQAPARAGQVRGLDPVERAPLRHALGRDLVRKVRMSKKTLALALALVCLCNDGSEPARSLVCLCNDGSEPSRSLLWLCKGRSEPARSLLWLCKTGLDLSELRNHCYTGDGPFTY